MVVLVLLRTVRVTYDDMSDNDMGTPGSKLSISSRLFCLGEGGRQKTIGNRCDCDFMIFSGISGDLLKTGNIISYLPCVYLTWAIQCLLLFFIVIVQKLTARNSHLNMLFVIFCSETWSVYFADEDGILYILTLQL